MESRARRCSARRVISNGNSVGSSSTAPPAVKPCTTPRPQRLPGNWAQRERAPHGERSRWIPVDSLEDSDPVVVYTFPPRHTLDVGMESVGSSRHDLAIPEEPAGRSARWTMRISDGR